MENNRNTGQIRILSHTFEEFVDRVKSFHGYEAIGVIIGGFMVDAAYTHLPKEGLFDVLCETPKCLPDAVQLLTPCTAGNGWMTVVNVGRFALTVYDKNTGRGVRVFVDPVKIKAWPELNAWFMKLKAKKEQDPEQILDETKRAGTSIFGVTQIKVADRIRVKRHRGSFAICPGCKEAYPEADGPRCLACQGNDELYEASDNEGQRC
jgi:formylmethanofuran dehydrogenase subunit E